MEAGSPALANAHQGAGPRAEPLLVVSGVSKQFGGTRALDNVGMDLRAGEILALLGENGAGKSTLIKILAGVYGLDSGRVTYRGEDVSGAVRRMPIAFIHQDLGLIDWMTVAENVGLARGFAGRVPGVARTARGPEAAARRGQSRRTGRSRPGRAGSGVGRRAARAGWPRLPAYPA